MNGRILEFKGEQLYRKAVREGFEQGLKEGKKEGGALNLVSLVKDGLLSENFAMKRAEEKYGVSTEKFKELMTSAEAEDKRLQDDKK